MTLAIDSHHHVWDPSQGDYSWMTDAHAPIRRVFGLADLAPDLAAAGVSHTVLVQTWSSSQETLSFLRLADEGPVVAGVVGWVDLTALAVGETLDELLAAPGGRFLKGIRHQVHDEPDPDWLRRDDVMRGLAELERRHLAYDLLIRPREIPAALEVAAAFPSLRLVVDHIAKPRIAEDGFEPWAAAMAPFSDHRSHVWCKLSGIVTEDAWTSRDDTRLVPFVNEVMALFGPSRTMYGSDWPVCLLAGPYGRTLGLLRRLLADRPEAEHAVLRASAVAAYRLAC